METATHKSLTINHQNHMKTYKTREEAKEQIGIIDDRTHYESHGEYARPDYTARKVRGGSRYYIHARRYFYQGTIYAQASGPLAVDATELWNPSQNAEAYR